MTLHVARPRELVELVVLTLLTEHPRHPYDMLRQLKIRGNTVFLTGLPRSLYHAVDRLVAEGFVVATETEREGQRPERTLYALTDEGREEYAFRLEALLAQPSDPATFHAALSMIGGLDPETVTRALKQRCALVEAEVARLGTTVEAVSVQVPRLFLVEEDYLRNQLAAEAAWVRRLVEEIESGELTWPAPPAGGADGADGTDGG